MFGELLNGTDSIKGMISLLRLGEIRWIKNLVFSKVSSIESSNIFPELFYIFYAKIFYVHEIDWSCIQKIP